MAGTSPDPACNNTDTKASKPNQACRVPDDSYLLVCSISFSSSPPISRCLIYNSTIIAELKVKSSLCISPCHDHEFTPSTVSTKYSIHQVQYPPKIICLCFILPITSWPLNGASGSSVPPYTIDRHQPALHKSWNVQSPWQIPMAGC